MMYGIFSRSYLDAIDANGRPRRDTLIKEFVESFSGMPEQGVFGLFSQMCAVFTHNVNSRISAINDYDFPVCVNHGTSDLVCSR